MLFHYPKTIFDSMVYDILDLKKIEKTIIEGSMELRGSILGFFAITGPRKLIRIGANGILLNVYK